jgi:dnd system-associated protein 4
MANIRMPQTARPLLQYCRSHNAKLEDAFFQSFAQMIIFAASLGWQQDEFDEAVAFCEKDPYPIPLETFKSLGLYDPILIITLARTKNFEVAKNDTEIAAIIEGFASAGFRYMDKIYGKCEGYEFLQQWVDVISKQPKKSD